ncbi:MAG: SUMF1/EgtB/PvdO family nonheme iron enzyme [Saprospiraceae bacterium]|jgi:formylglycine-generating enzyme required for sulfatase activity/predicted Ser/Thr protein kinase|nr:SUMF1/EgtB/PvdO family nonheme iron enzyme [Saprospiraceae bacterium]MCA0334387.1 bifunctional serine/threonine-protein kinase/formylglycine-generating enzyme family protein [Bacteroidota bacterium]
MINAILNAYTLKRFLGRGGMAEVWYAENNLGKPAAIKIMLAKFKGEKQVVDRFEIEAKAMVRLSHPNIREVLDYGEYEGLPFIIMEYLDGEDLGQLMIKRSRHSEKDLEQWWRQSLSALAHTHERGIIHRDIKPSNIFLQKNGQIKILDFGIAKIKDEISHTRTGQGLGTVLYMSPEQISDPKQVSPSTDIYSLGMTFASLLRGEPALDLTEDDSTFNIQLKITKGDINLSGINDVWRARLLPALNITAVDRPSASTLLLTPEQPSNPGFSNGDDTIIEDPEIKNPNTESPGSEHPLATNNKPPSPKYLFPLLIGLGLLIVGFLFYKKYSGFDSSDVVEVGIIDSMAMEDGEAVVEEAVDSVPVMEDTEMNDSKSKSFTTYTETAAGVSFKMVAIPGGTFSMGSNDGGSNERPVHSVSLSAYYMGETEVTQALWQAVMGTNPSDHKNCEECPVEKVSWNDAQKFISKLNQKTGKRYRLPTEAEWEYAAKGGQSYTYSGSNDIKDVAWYSENGNRETHPVKQKRANGYGLYDMSGNVWEWCADWYADWYAADYYSKSPNKNPAGPSAGNWRVLRGGSCYNSSEYCRVANRYFYNPSGSSSRYYGLRLAVSGP